jgi:hypothetical protein
MHATDVMPPASADAVPVAMGKQHPEQRMSEQ